MNNHHTFSSTFSSKVEKETCELGLSRDDIYLIPCVRVKCEKRLSKGADSSLFCRRICSLLGLLGVWTLWEELQTTRVA